MRCKISTAPAGKSLNALFLFFRFVFFEEPEQIDADADAENVAVSRLERQAVERYDRRVVVRQIAARRRSEEERRNRFVGFAAELHIRRAEKVEKIRAADGQRRRTVEPHNQPVKAGRNRFVLSDRKIERRRKILEPFAVEKRFKPQAAVVLAVKTVAVGRDESDFRFARKIYVGKIIGESGRDGAGRRRRNVEENRSRPVERERRYRAD